MARQALRLHRELPNARGIFGIRLAEGVQEWVRTRALTPLRWVADGYPTDVAQAAVSWLQGALAQEEDADGEVTAALAAMYGVTRQYQAMLELIEPAVSARPALRRTLQCIRCSELCRA
ncbi:MAG: hypothetical protein ACYDAG_12980 [Chloroflexota bacterium]